MSFRSRGRRDRGGSVCLCGRSGAATSAKVKDFQSLVLPARGYTLWIILNGKCDRANNVVVSEDVQAFSSLRVPDSPVLSSAWIRYRHAY